MLSLHAGLIGLLLTAMTMLSAPSLRAADADPQAIIGSAENTPGPVDKPKKLTDPDQPIHINASRIEIDQRKSLTVYTGKVSFTQGDLRIDAARAEARYQGDKIDTIVAHGKPVMLHQRASDPQQSIHAWAQRLEYHALKNRIDLFGDVRLQQGGSDIRSATLHYNLLDGTLTAEGDGQDGAVSVVIEPKEIKRPPASPAPKKPTTE